MADVEEKILHNVEYMVIGYKPDGSHMQVCFHGPNHAGWSSAESAKRCIEALETADAELGKIRVYDIFPVMVSETYGNGPEIMVDLTETQEDELQEIIDMATQEGESEGGPAN